MTHSAFSRSSCGMLSGTSITSCKTVPEFSKRSCSLFAANAELATNKMQTPRVNLRNIANLLFLLVDELRLLLNCSGSVVAQTFGWEIVSQASSEDCITLFASHR